MRTTYLNSQFCNYPTDVYSVITGTKLFFGLLAMLIEGLVATFHLIVCPIHSKKNSIRFLINNQSNRIVCNERIK